MANTENRLSHLPSQTDKLELQALKDANDTTLNDILDTINGVLSSKPNLNEIQTAEVYLANLKILSERFQSGIKNTMQGDNLDDEFNLYVGTKKRVQLLKQEMRQNMQNQPGTYDPLSDTARPFKNRKPGGSPLDTMMKGDEGEELKSGMIGHEEGAFDDGRGHAFIEGKFSDTTGFSAEGVLSHMLGEKTALVMDIEAGGKQLRAAVTFAQELAKGHEGKITLEHFQQAGKYMFDSGMVEKTVSQKSIGAAYRMKLNGEFLKHIETKGYITHAQSQDLADKTFYIDSPTLYELYNNKRRIAGGNKQGGELSFMFTPSDKMRVVLTANYESTKFDTKYEGDKHDSKKAGGKMAFEYDINDKTVAELSVGTNSVESLVTEAKLRYSLPENISFYIAGQHIQRRDGIGGSDTNEDIFAVGFQGNVPSWIPIFGEDTEAIKESARIVEKSKKNRKEVPYMPALHANRNPDALPPLSRTQSKQYRELLRWAEQPAVRSHTIVAVPDQRSDRLIAIDQTILPAAAHPDLMTGDLIVEIALATDIAGITKDGLSDNGNPSFTLNSSKNQLIINTATLAVPPAGTTQTYVVTINEVGGGQTLVTIDVQHGSVRISRVDIQRIAPAAPDTTPDAITLVDQNNVALSTVITSAPITVQGLTAPSPITVAGGEYSIDGGAWTAAAGTVTNGQTVRVRHTSSASNSTATNTTLTIGGVSDVFTSTTEAAPVIDAAPTVAAPTATKTDTTVTVTNHITDADGVQNITYSIYSDAATTILVNSNVNGAAFTGLTASTNYWVKTTAETRNGATGAWTLQTSPTLQVTTDAAVDHLAPDAPTGGPTLAAVGGVYYSKLATSNVTVTAAGVNGAGRIWLNGSDTGVDLIDGGSYNYDANVAEGNNNFNYTIKDAAGNESAPLTFSVFRDTVVPVVNDLPNWGAGVASGSTTAKTVTMTDNNPFAGSSVVSISPSVGSITGFDATTYGTNKPFNYVAPVNPAGSGPLTVTLTYTVRDAANNLTTQTQTFDVAEAPNANPVAQNFTADAAFNGFATVDLSGYISDAEDADAALQLIVTANPDNFTVDTSAWPTVTFIAPGGFLGNSSISYKIRDTLLGESGVQTITLNNFSN